MAVSKIEYTGAGNFTSMKVSIMYGNKRYRADSLITAQPYSIFAFGYRVAVLLTSTGQGASISEMEALSANTPSWPLSNGVIKIGTDPNRQYVALMPNNVTLVEVT